MNYETAEYSLYDSVSFLREQDDSNQSKRPVLSGLDLISRKKGHRQNLQDQPRRSEVRSVHCCFSLPPLS